jgi:hypothetical protein
MSTIRSKGGTTIAYDRHGDGPPVILVGGAFQHRAGGAGLTGLILPDFHRTRTR